MYEELKYVPYEDITGHKNVRPNPLVSVIIPTRNEEKNIEECINSIKSQTYKKIEIIVVDGNSIDNTRKIAKSLKARVLKENPPIGPANARNIGAKKAKGDIIFFIDVDSVIEEKYVKESVLCLMMCLDKAGISTKTELYPTNDLISNLSFAEKASSNQHVSPCVLWKHAFLNVKFDTSLGIGEDFDLSKRLAKKRYFYDSYDHIKVYHKEPDFKRLISESKWWGRTYKQLLLKGYSEIFMSFLWIGVVAFLIPSIVLSIFFQQLLIPTLLLSIVFFLYSINKIQKALKVGIKSKYAILLPFYKILRYNLLFWLIILNIFNKNKFRGE